jgi:hypothetical protein
VFTDLLPSNGGPIVGRVRLLGNMLTESLPITGSIRHSINMKACFGIQVIVLIDRYIVDPYFAEKPQ